MIYVLYNTVAGAHYEVETIKEKMKEFFGGGEFSFADALTLEDKMSFLSALRESDKLVIVGGDGTLNRFVNSIEDKEYPFPIYCYAGGTGNDFINDVSGVDCDGLVLINDYIRNLPVVEVNGKTYRFLNGIGYGLDGWACEQGAIYREKTGKAPSYTKIALKGLIYKFKTVKARVKIDGNLSEWENVWMVPTMNGRYFGGGVMIAPAQDRLNEGKNLSLVVVHSKSRLKLLTVFPKIFKGKHTAHTDIFKLFEGKEIEVELDRPIALQIDGETILGVTTYKAYSSALVKESLTV